MKTAITISQVAEAREGPFVFHTPLPAAFASAAAAGFDGVELFLPAPDFISSEAVRELADRHRLAIAAVGTGAGMLRHGLSLTDPSPAKREAALDFICRMVDFGGSLGAPAILGSMQGKRPPEMSRESAEDLLADGLLRISKRAADSGVAFIYEPLNRYETNHFNRLADAAEFLASRSLKNVVLLADLFHMNIEEVDLAGAIRAAAHHIGHVHYADTNRQAMGFGHCAAERVIEALRDVGYAGYLSAEILPLPDPETAARQTIQSIRSLYSNL